MLSLYLLSVSCLGALIGFYHLTYRKLIGKKPMGYFSSSLVVSAPFTLALWIFIEVGVDRMTVPSSSMLPSINIGDSFFVDKTAYQYNYLVDQKQHTQPEVGDIVIMKFPINTDVHYVKVYIAGEGKTVFINQEGIKVDQRLYPFEKLEPKEFQISKDKKQTLDQYIVNLNGRTHVFLKETGKVIESMELLVPAGGVFVLGTNLDFSGDSRQMGAISQSLIVGRKI